jgi:hypothetical protein
VRLEVSGTTLTVKYNGTTIDTATDSSLASGSAGVVCYDAGAFERADDWEGGNLGAGGGATPIPVFLHHLRQQGIS